MIELDSINVKILIELQKDGSLPQRALAEKIGLSQNALWRRLKNLHDTGVIQGYHAHLNPRLLGLELTVFMMVRTRHHSQEWAVMLRQHVEAIPQIIEMHRIGGEWDYLLKVVTHSMAGYDTVYQRLTAGGEFEKITGLFSMETIFQNRPIGL